MSRLYHLRFLLILLALLGSVAGVESLVTRCFGDQTLSPLLSLIALAILAYFFSPRQVLFALPFFALLSYLMIMDASIYPLVRSCTVLTGGGVAFWAARQRSRLSSQIEEIEGVLRNLPTPWILSDSAGIITRASVKRLNLPGAFLDPVGTSFFSFFSFPSKKDFIDLYIRSFEHLDPMPLAELTPTQSTKSYRVIFSFLSLREGRLLLSVFQSPAPGDPKE